LRRQVSWLAVQRVPSAFPDWTIQWMWMGARRSQLRGQPRLRVHVHVPEKLFDFSEQGHAG
jgi:hypothetical protein